MAWWMDSFSLIDIFAFAWFWMWWVGYTYFADSKAKNTDCLSSVLHQLRVQWVYALMRRENRVADASIIANLERNVSFFASASTLVLAGTLTALGTSDKMLVLAQWFPFIKTSTPLLWEFKLLLLASIFVYAFFKFTWSLRQYNFASIAVGGAPVITNGRAFDAREASLAEHVAIVLSRAAYAFNLGLRAYYFAMAILFWFLNPWALFCVTLIVVAVLYRREFHSNVLAAMVEINQASFADRRLGD